MKVNNIGIDLNRHGGFSQLRQLEQALEDYCALGFRMLEINPSEFGLIVNGNWRGPQLEDFQAVLRNFDLRYSVHAPDRLNLAYDPRADLCQRVLLSQVEICRAIRASRLVVHSSLDALSAIQRRVRPKLLTDDELTAGARREVATLRAVAPVAAEAGVVIGIENGAPNPDEFNLLDQFGRSESDVAKHHARLLVGPIVEQLEAVSHPNVAMTLDVAHLHLAASALDFDCLKAVAEAAPWVKHLHVNDNFGNLDQGYDDIPNRMTFGEGDIHLPPGWGSIPYRDVFARLPAYEGDLILELRPRFRDYFDEARQTMQKILNGAS
ncbi:MAG: sugar phosphate isomerase/epimerase family protein [Anaerolineales bacterium]